MNTHMSIKNKLQLVLNPFEFYFELVHCKEIFHHTNGFPYQTGYRADDKPDDLPKDNILTFQRM